VRSRQRDSSGMQASVPNVAGTWKVHLVGWSGYHADSNMVEL